MKTITKQDAVALVKKYADAEPDKNVFCVYVNAGEACCIVGNILINDLGADPEKILEFNGDVFSMPFSEEDSETRLVYGKVDHRKAVVLNDVEFTDDAVKVLESAQAIQDGRASVAAAIVGASRMDTYSDFDGATWGDAGRFVEKYFGASE